MKRRDFLRRLVVAPVAAAVGVKVAAPVVKRLEYAAGHLWRTDEVRWKPLGAATLDDAYEVVMSFPMEFNVCARSGGKTEFERQLRFHEARVTADLRRQLDEQILGRAL